MSAAADVDRLTRFAASHPRLFVLSGAGVSTDSGIPDYRDAGGKWKRRSPVRYQEFVRSEAGRRRYWARSLVGWSHFSRALPNDSHQALAALERMGRILQLVTQNVDGLHQRAGARRVIDLHGRIDRVRCLSCDHTLARDRFQQVLQAANPHFTSRPASWGPDGDADIDEAEHRCFRVPPCNACGGILKPAVVFFGEEVPRPRVTYALERLAAADALLVAGSSLMVNSGFRFARLAAELGKPIAVVNLGRTRADDVLELKIERPCGLVLPRLAQLLAGDVTTSCHLLTTLDATSGIGLGSKGKDS